MKSIKVSFASQAAIENCRLTGRDRRIAAEEVGLGSMSMDYLREYDLSAGKAVYDIPVLENSQSRISDVRKGKNRCRLDVALDGSGRAHRIESRIETMQGVTVRSFRPAVTRRKGVSLHWNHSRDNGQAVEQGLYVWHVTVDGIRHSRVIF